MSGVPSYKSYKFKDESQCVEDLAKYLTWDSVRTARIAKQAEDLITHIRTHPKKTGLLENFLKQYPLSSKEGLALMSLAEAYIRIPDATTRNALIRDKLNTADWGGQKGAEDWFMRLAGMGLMASKGTLNSMLGKIAEPFIRTGVEKTMRMMGQQFVLGESIHKALNVSAKNEDEDYSFDMLGEGARTDHDAQHYFEQYAQAIDAISAFDSPKPAGISVKLSALHPRYETAKKDTCLPVICERLRHLVSKAAEYNMALTIDAEEMDRLDLSVEIFDHILRAAPKNWRKLGLAVQAYHKQALPLIDHIITLTKQAGQRIRIRLVKGAYWDSEIKHAQVHGHPDYPVFTRKCNADLSYLACAQKLFEHTDTIYPMFATHNACTIAAILELAGENQSYEFQRLHGMGEALYEHLKTLMPERTVTVYAPVGAHKNLLPYLVRRLLENGANSSFIHKLYDVSVPVSDLIKDPVKDALEHETKRHAHIPLPKDIFEERPNSFGLDLSDQDVIEALIAHINAQKDKIEDLYIENTPFANVNTIFKHAQDAYHRWSDTCTDKRADILNAIADTFETHKTDLIAYLVHEARKTISDADAEVREAVDFCRYYAAQARIIFHPDGQILPGPTGEKNLLCHKPRGTFLCISPWNFPLAIFTGQITAALAAGNSVIAKPAEQTPKIAAFAHSLMEQAGLPKNTLQLVYGDGALGAELTYNEEVAGVAFTGSTEVAKKINMTLAAKEGPITPLIAETGGQNAMIIDSSALPEQVIDDVIHSAFGAAGQRCSALRVLYVQNEIADTVIEMLRGAVKELTTGPVQDISTDIPPVIDGEAHNRLIQHKNFLDANGTLIAKAPDPVLQNATQDTNFYFTPHIYEIESLDLLERENFGPILHVIRFPISAVEHVIEDINATGYGLTFGMHSRIETRWRAVSRKIRAGNLYINRGMTGAVVGAQPFGGRGLSGTGPKAGGPAYLKAFACEKVTSIDTTASGGNAPLVSLDE